MEQSPKLEHYGRFPIANRAHLPARLEICFESSESAACRGQRSAAADGLPHFLLNPIINCGACGCARPALSMLRALLERESGATTGALHATGAGAAPLPAAARQPPTQHLHASALGCCSEWLSHTRTRTGAGRPCGAPCALYQGLSCSGAAAGVIAVDPAGQPCPPFALAFSKVRGRALKLRRALRDASPRALEVTAAKGVRCGSPCLCWMRRLYCSHPSPLPAPRPATAAGAAQQTPAGGGRRGGLGLCTGRVRATATRLAACWGWRRAARALAGTPEHDL